MMGRPRSKRQRRRRAKIKPPAERIHLPTRSKRFSTRAPHARRYDLWPGAWSQDMAGHPWSRVELRIAANRFWMLREAWLLGASVAADGSTQGCVIAPRRCGRPTRGQRGRVCTVLLNEVDLLASPSELGAHEMTHAAMRFLDIRGVEITGKVADEEVLCYTVGELVRQLNRIFYAHGYRRPFR